MENFYHLSKKELSYFSLIEAPIVVSGTKKRISTPVVLVISLVSGDVVYVWSLSWFKSKVRNYPNELLPSCFRYEIRIKY